MTKQLSEKLFNYIVWVLKDETVFCLGVPFMRGKLIEALDTGMPEAIQFSNSEDLPTVLFVMGANGMGVSHFQTIAFYFWSH